MQEFSGNLERAAVELAQEWRGDKQLRQLEAMLIVMDKNSILVVSGTGEVISPDDDLIAIGSGGNYALSAGRALKRHTEMAAKDIAHASLKVASEICVFTNDNVCRRIISILFGILNNNIFPEKWK